MAKAWKEVKDSKEEIIKALKGFEDSGDKTTALTKTNATKKWPPDSGTLSAIQKAYEAAAKAKAEDAPQEIGVALKSYTKPKFAHNATKAGTLPVWTFQYTDKATKKSGTVDITMTTSMTKDEPTAKKLMSEAAVAEVKKHYPKATVKVDNTSLNS